MRLVGYLLPIILSLFVSRRVPAQIPASVSEKLDEYLRSAQQANHFNGVALIAQRGKILLHNAYGVRNAATKAPNDTTTRFPILSITKSFTAALILKLQEQGNLSVNDKLSRYLPQFPNGDKITLHQLLTHTSGLFNYTDLIDEADSALVCHPVPRQTILDLIQNKPPAFQPGKRYSYNNSGFFLLGLVIEKVTGESYELAVRELLFQPLGMTHSGFDFINLPPQSRAFGYDTLTPTYYSPYPHPDSTVLFAAGGMYSTTRDILQWGKAVANQQFLSTGSWKQAFKKGYGWKTGTYANKSYVWHDGGYPGFMAQFVYYPGEDLTIILFNNFANYHDSLFPIVLGISNVTSGNPYDLWQSHQEIIIDETTLKQYIGHYQDTRNRQLGTNVVLRNGRLLALGRSKNQIPEITLYAGGQDSFYTSFNNNRITFKRDGSGRVISCLIRENGQDYNWKKVN